MSNHILILILGSALGISLLTSCQPLPDPYDNRFGTNRSPINIGPSVRTNGAELFASNPLVEFQTTGANPAPIRTLSAGETLTVLRKDGRFTQVRLMDGTAGYINSSDITQGSGNTGAYYDNRVPDQYGNRFGGGNQNTEVTPPTDYPPIDPITPTNPTNPTPSDPDIIDLDNF